jgi:perosamine synthetase
LLGINYKKMFTYKVRQDVSITRMSTNSLESWPFWKTVPRFEPEYSVTDFLRALAALITRDNCETMAFRQFPADCLFFRSGRECLYAILKALKLRDHARVGVPLYCCPSVFGSITAAGHMPVFLDVNLDTYSLDLDSLERNKNGLDAVVIVHTFGYPANLGAIRTCLGARQIPMIEDCAHAFLSEYQGGLLGTHTQASFFSFGLHKPAAVGGGGVTVFNDPTLAKSAAEVISVPAVGSRLEEFRHVVTCGVRALAYQRVIYGALLASPLGRRRDARVSSDGETLEDTIQYSLARMRQSDQVLLSGRLDEFGEKLPILSRNAQRFRAAIQGVPLELPEEPSHGKWNHFLLPARYRDGKRRTTGRQFLTKHRVDTGPLYQNCVPGARHFGYSGGCPNAEKAAETVCTIPHHPWLSDSEIEFIGQLVRRSSEFET